MTKYLLKRILHGVCSLIIIVGIVMILVYSVMDRNLIFAKDSTYTHAANNAKIIYKYGKWEEYGYLDYVPYADYLQGLKDDGEIDEDTMNILTTMLKKEINVKLDTKYPNRKKAQD